MTKEFPRWLNKWISCCKFADDGTFVVAHHNRYKCYRLMQRLCSELNNWCKRNKLIINCDVNKTEAIILKSQNKIYQDHPPDLYIGKKTIQYVKSTKVLGLILDDQLKFINHAQSKLAECNKKWSLLTKATNRNFGLNVRSMLLLFNTTVLSKLLYAAPVWLKRNLHHFDGFWNSAIMKITGATLNPNRNICELVLHLPSLEVQLEVITAKFLCKLLCTQDEMKSILIQADGSLTNEFNYQLKTIKKYVLWKSKNQHKRIRNVELINVCNRSNLMYTHIEMKTYQQHVWLDRMKNSVKVSKSVSNDIVKDTIKYIEAKNIILDNKNSIFNHSTTKKEDSYLLDYIHGNSILFGNCQSKISEEEGEECCFCNAESDSAKHQLLHCTETTDVTLLNLISQIDWPANIVKSVVVPTRLNKQTCFIERVKHLISLHDNLCTLQDNY